MHLRSLASFARAALALAATAVLAASCGARVGLEDYPEPCAAGLTLCDGECVDLDVDLNNCGQCGAACFEGTCFQGACEAFPECPPNSIGCSGTCVDPDFDPQNCGGCGISCGAGFCDLGVCQTGECLCDSLCNIISLGSFVPQTAFGAIPSAADQWIPFCVSGSGADVVFSFFAPQTGQYTFDTFGSPGGVVLQVLTGACASYGCDSSGFAGGAVVPVFLGVGEQVFVIVDSQGQAGEVQLNINQEGDCLLCGEFISGEGPPADLCPGSDQLYDQLITCVCVDTCAMQCEKECSQGGDLSPECEGCIYDSDFGCGNPLNECANDI